MLTKIRSLIKGDSHPAVYILLGFIACLFLVPRVSISVEVNPYENFEAAEEVETVTEERREESVRATTVRQVNLSNIRKTSDRWVGAVACDGPFVCFEDESYALRATIKLLQTYYNKHGLETIEEVVARWAPPSENATREVTKTVAKIMGYHPTGLLDLNDMDEVERLAKAIIRMETGTRL